MRLAHPRQVVEAPADRLISAGAAEIGRSRHVCLRLVHAELATLRLEEAHVGGELPCLRHSPASARWVKGWRKAYRRVVASAGGGQVASYRASAA